MNFICSAPALIPLLPDHVVPDASTRVYEDVIPLPPLCGVMIALYTLPPVEIVKAVPGEALFMAAVMTRRPAAVSV